MFAHVPKTAGSSVRTYLDRRFGKPALRDHTVLDPSFRFRQRGFINKPAHSTAADLLEFTPLDMDLSF